MRRVVLAVVAIAVVLAPPLAWSAYRAYHFRNLKVVAPGFLLRGGQLSPHGLKRLWYEQGIGTVVSLRENDELKGVPGVRWEEQFCKEQDIAFVRLPPRRWHGKDRGPIPAQANVDRFLEVLADPVKYPRPIYLHCFKGTHRTGVFVAIFRMEVEGWSNAQAIAELQSLGYDKLEEEPDVYEFLRNYQPRSKRGITH